MDIVLLFVIYVLLSVVIQPSWLPNPIKVIIIDTAPSALNYSRLRGSYRHLFVSKKMVQLTRDAVFGSSHSAHTELKGNGKTERKPLSSPESVKA